MKTYTIHLIRHGLTEGNLLGQYIGSTDVPLARQGREQLQRLMEHAHLPYCGRYYSSPLKRCLETMALLYPDQTPEIVKDLAEYDFGAFEKKTGEQLQEDPDYLEWLAGGPDACPPLGESNQHFAGRVCGAFEKIVEDLMRTGVTSAAICTHGGVIMTLMSAYGLPERPFHEWMVGNGEGYTLRITPGIWMRGYKLEVFPLQSLPNETEEED